VSKIDQYDIGDSPRFSVSFLNASTQPADPTGVVFSLRAPSGTRTTFTFGTDAEVVKLSVGNYYIDRIMDASGRWSWKWNGSGVLTAAVEGSIYVNQSAF